MDVNNKNLEGQRLLKAAEVASYLNISKSFVYQLISQGKLRTVTINSAKRVRVMDLMAFIDSSLTPSPNLTFDS